MKKPLGSEKASLDAEKASLGAEKASIGAEKASVGAEKASVGAATPQKDFDYLELHSKQSASCCVFIQQAGLFSFMLCLHTAGRYIQLHVVSSYSRQVYLIFPLFWFVF